ncbi:MAG: RsmB/NOP family class I SAM-dependent RNA methyltransferase [Crenarchaeota archaeon]|nr:RsmB/NOP family class I SAM-dependent RNA methyltransferase [Thermoproteota archaeon]
MSSLVYERGGGGEDRSSKLSREDVEVLIEVVKEAERVHPSQEAKRRVFSVRGVLGTSKDRVLTAIYYKIMRMLGIVDKALVRALNLPSVHILDPWLRAALRVACFFLVFNNRDVDPELFSILRGCVAKFLSEKTHPYVGVWYWDAVDKVLRCFRYVPLSEVEELELKYLVPSWLIEKLKIVLEPGEVEEFLRAVNRVPKICVRVNTLKASVEEVERYLRRHGKAVERSRYVSTVLKFHGPFEFERCPLYREGKIVNQDEACALASIILDPRPGETVVDMCAAPGGKTSHMAELMRNTGRIYAFDVDAQRIERMRRNLKRLGVSNVRIIERSCLDAPKILGEEIADKVLLDPPCSSTGTLAKYPEVRWRLRPEKVRELAEMQYRMLETAVRLCRPGGRILYTTCSILPEECEHVVKKILEKYEGIVRLVSLDGPFSPGLIRGTMRAWPHRHDTIGFFYALLEKVRST